MDSTKELGSPSDLVVTGTLNTNPLTEGTNSVIKDVKPGPLKISRGIENAKKRLRAFSIQKKPPITPVVVQKPSTGGTTTVLIGKLSSVKPTTPKVDDEQKKIPKPPKPGAHKKCLQDSYVDLQKRTLAEIEDMKRKMELVDLGIPLGLICPSSSSEKAMPTKAMPPIKHFLGGSFRIYNTQRSSHKQNHPAKVDEIIREAKKARDEGKKYKFDYQKLLPNYDNPFQRKKDDDRCKTPEFRNRSDFERNKRKSDRYDSRRHSDHRRVDRDRYKTRVKEKARDRTKDKSFEQEKEKKATVNVSKEVVEANVNLNDYLVCDSWSLDNEDRNSSSPKGEDRLTKKTIEPNADVKCEKAIPQLIRDSALKNKDMLREYTRDSPVRLYIKENPLVPFKMAKLQPVIDSFKFEIDPNDEEILDIFDEDSGLEKYARKEKIHTTMYSPTDMKLIEYDQDESKDVSVDDTNDDNFLESVINEIKQEDINEDISQDKALVEYDISPVNKEVVDSKSADIRISVTPELDERMRDVQSQRSDYSDGYRSNESGYKTSDTTESGYKSIDSFRMSMEKELNEDIGIKMSKSTVDSLETWSFVLKICQPLLFRHDKNKCYRETRVLPKLWYTENPKLCNCVKDRKVVYSELQLCKMNLVDRVYGCDQIPDAPSPKCRNWYPRPHLCLTETHTVPVSQEWEGEDMAQSETICRLEKEDSRRRSNTPQQNDEVCLDSEYQRFMKAVWPEVAEAQIETPRSTTPVRQEGKKKKREEVDKEAEVKKSAKKLKLSSEGWSQESDLEEEMEKSKKVKIDKEKLRKRKRSSSTLSSFSDSEPEAKKKKKAMKKKVLKKSKWKSAKRRRIGKKILKKLKKKEKKKKRSGKIEKINDSGDDDSENKKNLKKKKQQKLKKKNLKRKKKEVSISTSTSSCSDSSTDESEEKSKKSKKSGSKKKKEKRRNRKSTSDSAQSEELFDVNILNNIKTERLTDDEKSKSLMDFSPRRQQKPREIINVKELQNDFVGNNIHVKKEMVEEKTKNLQDTRRNNITESNVDLESPDKITEVSKEVEEEANDVQVSQYISAPSSELKAAISLVSPVISQMVPNIDMISTVPPRISQRIPTVSQVKPVLEESNMSQCSSQESVCSVKPYEKDDSHLRPSSQNSNYSFNDVINASQSGLYQKGIDSVIECEDKFHENYQQDNYEMFEHLAMAYQSDVASHQASPPCSAGEQRIETVVRARSRGEIKCDWRAGLSPALLPPPAKPSRWGLKPGEVNIVLTGGGDYAPQPTTPVQQQQQQQQPQPQPQPRTVQHALKSQPVYKIQSLANRMDISISGYDEAYMDMYGASDRLQYGDCFSEGAGVGPDGIVASVADIMAISAPAAEFRTSTLDARIDHALKTTVLGEVAKEVDSPVADEKKPPEKGILIMSSVTTDAGRVAKRVSFADGYKPGQDSDVEDPPVKKKRKVRRTGCAWPCAATHPDHVALWDALPPPPPPPGSPPPPRRAAPPLHLLRAPPAPSGPHLAHRPALTIPMALPPRLHKIDTNSPLPVFIPTEPPPNLVSFP